MPTLPLPAVAAALMAAAAGAAPASRPADALSASPYRLAQIVVQQRVVIRLQRAAAPTERIVWAEKKGPKCIALDDLAGALIVEPEAVDLVSVGGERVRARLDRDCPALDFYAGFYIQPTADGKVCARRDAVRSRSGRKCGIDAFRKLVPKR